MRKIHIICFIIILFSFVESRGQSITANDHLIAHDSVHSVTYDENTVWNVRRFLMEKLLSDTSLISSDTIITNFYNSHVSDNIGKLSNIRVAISTINVIDSSTKAAIQSNVAQIDSNILYIINTTNDSLIKIYNSNVAAYSAANDSIYNVIQTAKNERADTIKSWNDAIASSLVYEQNEINVNDIYLNTVAKGQFDSVSNYSSTLYNIATQCPLSGGPGVFYARSLYHSINDSIIYDDDRMCASPSDTCLVPPTPGLISGRYAGVCGHQFYYNIDTVPTASSYTWSLSGYAEIDSGQGSSGIWISFTDTFVVGAISVYASDSCGNGHARSLVAIGAPPSPDSITGTSTLCPYASNNPFSTDSVQGATTYTWVVPSGCTIDSGQGTKKIYVNWGSDSGNVVVVASNACGTSDSTYHAVTVANNCRGMQPGNHGISYSIANGKINIYPNPTTGMVTVVYQLSSSQGLLQLYDAIGQLVGSYQLNGNNNQFEFDASPLCCGIFYYKVTDANSLTGEGKMVIIR